MKPALKISIVVNICLAALALGGLARYARVSSVNSPGGVATSVGESMPVAQPVEERVSRSVEKNFQWSRIEFPDYRTYMANLRSIGCPEQTIRDIITADVESIYAPRRAQLQQELTGQPNQRTLQTELQELRSEESGVLLTLLGAASAPQTEVAVLDSQVVAATVPMRRSRFSSFPANTRSIPIAFQDPGPELELDPEQIAIINDLRATFKSELKGLDPASPEYRQRWQQAKSTADQSMCALLGYSFWLDYLTHARNQRPDATSSQ